MSICFGFSGVVGGLYAFSRRIVQSGETNGVGTDVTGGRGCGQAHPPDCNRASNPENRSSVRWLRTATASAFFWPMSMTNFLPRVIPV